MHQMNLLVIDDDPVKTALYKLREDTVPFVADWCNTVHITSTEEIRQTLLNFFPDVILLDYHLPGGPNPVFDVLLDYANIVNRPLLILPNTSDYKGRVEMQGRFEVLKREYAKHGNDVYLFSSLDAFVETTSRSPFVYGYFDQPFCSELWHRSMLVFNNESPKTSLPVTKHEFEQIEAELIASYLVHRNQTLYTFGPGPTRPDYPKMLTVEARQQDDRSIFACAQLAVYDQIKFSEYKSRPARQFKNLANDDPYVKLLQLIIKDMTCHNNINIVLDVNDAKDDRYDLLRLASVFKSPLYMTRSIQNWIILLQEYFDASQIFFYVMDLTGEVNIGIVAKYDHEKLEVLDQAYEHAFLTYDFERLAAIGLSYLTENLFIDRTQFFTPEEAANTKYVVSSRIK